MRISKFTVLLVAMVGLLSVSNRQLVFAEDAKTSKLKFELYQDKASEFRWRLKAGNGEVLATGGQGYKDKADAKHAVERIQSDAGAADKLKFEEYQDNKQESRWRLHASNGQVIASSSQGYKSKEDCAHAIDLIKEGAKDASVEEGGE